MNRSLRNDVPGAAASAAKFPPPWTALALGAACCVVAWLCAAPDRIERTRVHVSGGAGAVAALQAAIAHADGSPAIRIVPGSDTITVSARQSASPFADRPPDPGALLAQAIDGLPPPAQPIRAAAAANPTLPLLTAQRAGLQGELGDADHDAAMLSASMSDTARAIAGLQQADAAPPSDPASDPLRALLAQAQMRRIELAAKYNADFPGIAMADSEIAGLQALAQHQKPARPSSRAALATLRAEQSRLQAAFDAATTRHAESPPASPSWMRASPTR